MTHTYRRPTDRPTSRDASHLTTITRKYFLLENNHETAAALPGAVSMLSPVNSDFDGMCGGASQI